MKRSLPPDDPVVPPQTHPHKKLKVEDALSYLDQVKYEFREQPQMYDDFLAIMKDFKTESIDTIGVIHRIFELFRGRSELIAGFNQFLPLGYKIDVLPNEQVHLTVSGTLCEGGPTSAPSFPPSGPPTTTPIHPGQSSQSDHSPAKSLLSFSGLLRKEPSDSLDSASVHPTDSVQSHSSHERSSVVSNLFESEPTEPPTRTDNHPTERSVSNLPSSAAPPLSFEGLFKKESSH